VTKKERDSLAALERWGLVDVFREFYEDDGLFSWWDYRDGAFHKKMGLRIDLLMASQSLLKRANFCLVDRTARKGKKPSDHAPVFVDVDH
jgi:exodeoxyribonuclease-3